MDARKLSVVALLAFAGTLDAQVRSVTLSEAIDLALQVNPAMVQARGDVLNAVASRRENLGSWLPSVTGSSSYSTNSASRFDPNTQRTVSAASTSYSAGLSATLNVFDGFRRNAEGRSATAGLESAEASLLNQRYQIILQTKQAFFNSLAADELVLVAERRIERADRQLDISREKLAHGTAIRSDTLRSVVELANARLQLLNAQTQRSTADANLARLIGVDGEVRARPDPSSLDQAVMLDTAMVRRQALQNSPEIVQSEAQARAAQAQMAVSRAQYFPTVTASYSNSFAGSEISDLNNTWTARLSLSWPLFNGFTRESNQQRSRVSYAAASARVSDARRNVNAQVTQWLASYQNAQVRLEIAHTSMIASEEDLRVQQERYRLGVATIVDVLTSQVNVDQAQVDEVQARLDVLTAKAQLEALLGEDL